MQAPSGPKLLGIQVDCFLAVPGAWACLDDASRVQTRHLQTGLPKILGSGYLFPTRPLALR